MKKNVIIIAIGALVLVGGAALGFFLGWFMDNKDKPEADTFVYNDSIPIDLDQKTQVYDFILLDMSGSMDTIRESVVEAFNTLLDGLKAGQQRYAGTQEHYLTLRLFCTEGLFDVYRMAPLDSVEHLSLDDYMPMGGTPLYDAMGTSISMLAEVTDTVQYGTVLFTVISDGLENASMFYSKAMLKRMVRVMADEGWLFSYMGTDDAVIKEALNLNIDSVYYFEQTDSGTRRAMRLDENSRVEKYRAIDSIRRREAAGRE